VIEIGFIQGRLSPPVQGRIQAFPRDHWRDEFVLARTHDFPVMEWTLDQDGLNENPLMTEAGRKEIRDLGRAHDLRIPTLTGDCFMQAPFYKAGGGKRRDLLGDAARIIEACADLDLGIIVVPLVDNGALESAEQEADLRLGLAELAPLLKAGRVRIAFESDFPPHRLAGFIADLDPDIFGINYDIGNSAALGYDFREEIAAYGDRIANVHVKDRLLGGTTVPLGRGAADLAGAIQTLARSGYSGPYMLQTARAEDGDHAGILCAYRDLVLGLLEAA